MKRVLSIDWDYFINCSARDRLFLFPDAGNEYISEQLQLFIWDSHYKSYPQIRKIGVTKDFDLMKEVCLSYRGISPLVAVSHRHIYDYIESNTRENEVIEVYNVDFHHDMYHYRSEGGDVNCGNWVNCLQKIRPNMKYHWIKRSDSDLNNIEGEVKCIYSPIEVLRRVKFDMLFLCRSDCWSPPHLDKKFLDLVDAILHNPSTRISIEKYAEKPRRVPSKEELDNQFGLVNVAIARDMKKYANGTCVMCGAPLPEGRISVCPACERTDRP